MKPNVSTVPLSWFRKLREHLCPQLLTVTLPAEQMPMAVKVETEVYCVTALNTQKGTGKVHLFADCNGLASASSAIVTGVLRSQLTDLQTPCLYCLHGKWPIVTGAATQSRQTESATVHLELPSTGSENVPSQGTDTEAKVYKLSKKDVLYHEVGMLSCPGLTLHLHRDCVLLMATGCRITHMDLRDWTNLMSPSGYVYCTECFPTGVELSLELQRSSTAPGTASAESCTGGPTTGTTVKTGKVTTLSDKAKWTIETDAYHYWRSNGQRITAQLLATPDLLMDELHKLTETAFEGRLWNSWDRTTDSLIPDLRSGTK